MKQQPFGIAGLDTTDTTPHPTYEYPQGLLDAVTKAGRSKLGRLAAAAAVLDAVRAWDAEHGTRYGVPLAIAPIPGAKDDYA